MIYSYNPSTVLNGTEWRRRWRRRCECGCGQNYNSHQTASNPRVNQLRGDRSSERNPPPPYPGPAPSNEAPPPPYWTLHGPRLPYYEPPPPYYPQTPVPRPRRAPVEYLASRPCQLGPKLHNDLFFVDVVLPVTLPANFKPHPR
uniref:SFRICE_040096 n=1 Tax=Spodoptera frugiperda TaxID=7108 RepID=A0A2H1WXK4_SPOFR